MHGFIDTIVVQINFKGYSQLVVIMHSRTPTAAKANKGVM